MSAARDGEWTVEGRDAGAALAGWLRARLEGCSWREVKRLIETGKVAVGGARETDEGRRLRAGDVVALRMAAPRARAQERPVARIVFEDTHVVVIDKPAGVASVPSPEDDASAMDLVREAWRREGRPSSPLFKVHRIDKPTSGLLAYARTDLAERALYNLFRAREADRTYVLCANGEVQGGTIDRHLVKDRGDGLCWTAAPGREHTGKNAITHVRVVEALRGATLCTATLDTGRTHQIRVHLAASGHPLVGEPLYIRDGQASGEPLLAAPRMLLHAATLGFPHPVSGEPLAFTAPLPDDFKAVLATLGWSGREPI